MDGDLKWLIGLAATFGLSLIGAFKSLSKSIKDSDDALHQRINRTRDDYVRRVDMDFHMAQLRGDVKELKDETKENTRETNKRLDQVIAALGQGKNG